MTLTPAPLPSRPTPSAEEQPGVDLTAELFASARDNPGRAALILPRGALARRLGRRFRTTTYAELAARVEAVAAGFRTAGVSAGTRTAVLVPPGEDFFVVMYALLAMRAVPVLVDPGIGRPALRTCLREADPEAFVGVARAGLASRLLGWCPGARLVVVTGTPGRLLTRVAFLGLLRGARTLRSIEGGARGRRGRRGSSEGPADRLAAVAFTSGSTGLPKGVEYTAGQLRAQIRLLREVYGMEPGEVSLATFPPFALLGPAMGLTTVIPPMDATRPASVDARALMAAVDEFGATVMFGSPALLDTVTRWSATGGRTRRRGSSLTRVLSAGAPVPRSVQRRMLTLLAPGAQVFTPYGATEALPVTSIGSTELLALRTPGICIGRAVPGVDVGVFPLHPGDGAGPVLDDRDLLPAGEVGEIVVRGDNVTAAYLGRPEATARAKTAWGGRLAHRMGDAGYVDENGRLWFCGRVAHRVVTRERTMWSVPCEEVFNVHRSVRRSALVGVGALGDQRPVICVELEPGAQESRALADELLELAAGSPETAPIRTLLFVGRMPVDIRHNSKIRREELAERAAARLS